MKGDHKTHKWVKPYRGPFFKEEVQKMVKDFMDKEHVVGCYYRKRHPKKWCVCTAACGAGLGHNDRYDLFIKIRNK